MRPVASCVAAVSLAAALAACGGGSHGGPTAPRAEQPALYSATAPLAAVPARIPAPPAADERVIRRWADLLRRGDVPAAARQFAFPAVAQAAPGRRIVMLRTPAQARAFNAALPCAPRVLRTQPTRGQGEVGLTIAAVRVTERTGTTCTGRAATARIGFTVEGGRITRWIRLAAAADAGRS